MWLRTSEPREGRGARWPRSLPFLLIGLIAAVPTVRSSTIGSKRHVVEVSGFAFQPAILRAAVGDTVVWINRDVVPHTATASDSAWNSGIVEAQRNGSIVIEKRGEQMYFCIYHPTMKAKLVVR